MTDQCSLIPRPLPVFQFSACNIEKLGVAWGQGWDLCMQVIVMPGFIVLFHCYQLQVMDKSV